MLPSVDLTQDERHIIVDTLHLMLKLTQEAYHEGQLDDIPLDQSLKRIDDITVICAKLGGLTEKQANHILSIGAGTY